MNENAKSLLGRIPARSRFFLGPMAGCTNTAMRRICIAHGAGMVFAEMVKAEHLLAGGSFTRKLLNYHRSEHPIFAQILAADVQVAADAAWHIEGLGFDGVELNAGCPIRRIMSRGLGAALLYEPSRLGRIVAAMVEAVTIPVTVKLRSGPGKGKINAPELAQVCEAAGAEGVGVHARSASAGYRGKADWSVLTAVKVAVSIPVFGSGDVFSAADAMEMIRQTDCDVVLIARGALGNPWIFRQVLEMEKGASQSQLTRPEAHEVGRVMKLHYHMLVEDVGRQQANLVFRRVGGEYCQHLLESGEFKKRLQGSREDEDLTEIMESIG